MGVLLFLVQNPYRLLTTGRFSFKERKGTLLGMKRFLTAALLGLAFLTVSPATEFVGKQTSHAAERFNLQESLRRLNANPRYRGKVLGTRVIRSSRGRLIEVRILRPNDRIILVFIDPRTGGVVGESSY